MLVRDARRQGNVEYLIAALHDTDPAARDGAASALGTIGDPRAVEPLVRRLRAGDNGHKILAIQALRAIGDPGAIPELYELATDTREFGQVRILAMSAAGVLGDRRVIPLLAEVLVDPESAYSHPMHRSSKRATRRWAARWIVELNGYEAVPRLEQQIEAVALRDRLQIRRVINRLRSRQRETTRAEET
jgi:HEAT repeat protein